MKHSKHIAFTCTLAAVVLATVARPKSNRSDAEAASDPDTRHSSQIPDSRSLHGQAGVKRAGMKKRPTIETAEGVVFADYRIHPYPVTRSSNDHGWVDANGKDPKVISQLAHNELEAQRLMDDNRWVKERQLVYRKTPLHQAALEARRSGKELKTVTFPGTNGTEYIVEVTESNFTTNENSELEGHIRGTVQGHPDSEVYMASYLGRELGELSGGPDGTHILYLPREEGQILVQGYDPRVLSEISSAEHPHSSQCGQHGAAGHLTGTPSSVP